MDIDISIIIPVYNEADNLPILHDKLLSTLRATSKTYEIIYIDDGSSDDSMKILEDIHKKSQKTKIVQLSKNFGQTAALTAGIEYAKGDIMVLMDADLQNDPVDIPRLLKKLEEGYDVVSGWRKIRKDPLFTRKLPSFLANKLISWSTGVYLHDYGCTLKAYKREFLKHIRLYGEMHRFIPAYASWYGGKVCEIVVNHHPRIHGSSKYGMQRTIKVILDLLTVKFLGSYSTKPIYVFGTVGMAVLLLAVMLSIFVVIRKLFFGGQWISPMIIITAVLFTTSVQFMLLGFLAEMITRTYFESQDKPIYYVKRTINIGHE